MTLCGKSTSEREQGSLTILFFLTGRSRADILEDMLSSQPCLDKDEVSYLDQDHMYYTCEGGTVVVGCRGLPNCFKIGSHSCFVCLVETIYFGMST